MPSYFVELTTDGQLMALHVTSGETPAAKSGGGIVREISESEYQALYEKFLRSPLRYENGEFVPQQNCTDC